MQSFIILGGHGDGLVVARAIEDARGLGEPCELLGFLNDHTPSGQTIGGVAVLGRTDDWPKAAQDAVFIAALHKVKAMPERTAKIAALGIPRARWGNVVHPRASVAPCATIGVGNFIAQNVVIQPNATLGDHNSLRAGANLGHDTKIEDYCYVGPNATLCGRASLECAVHLGPNSVVGDGLRVGGYCVVGIGSAVVRDLQPNGVYFGVPARRIGELDLATDR